MLRGAVIGLGRMGLTHFSILNTHPQVDLVAVCDSSSFVRTNLARQMHVKSYKDADKMIREMKPDFVIVATPTAMHADLAERTITHNVHTFLEKPFTLHPEQARYLAELARSSGLVHQVGYAMRFHDVFLEVKTLLDSQALGKLLVFTVEMKGPVVLHDVRSSWRSRKQEGGGCLYDFASHAVDLVNFLIGPPSDVVGTVFSHLHSDAVEDALCSTFLYEDGLRGTLLANWSDPSCRKPSCRFEALGTKGKVIADFYTCKVFFHAEPEAAGYVKGWNEKYLADIAEPVRFYVRGFQFTRQLDYFVDCILKHRSSDVCSFEDGLRTDLIMHRIRTDGETRRSHDG